MSVKISRSHVALLALAFAAGCSSEEPAAEKTRKVTGSLSAESLAGLAVPSVVAQSETGQTFDGPVTSDGSFTVEVPVNATYRLFITDLSSSGVKSTSSRVLWPGSLRWATVPEGTTSDGPVDVGSIQPQGTTDDGAVAGSGGAGGTAATGGQNGSNSAGASSSGGGAGGSSGGSSGEGSSEHGSTDDGSSGGGSGSGKGGETSDNSGPGSSNSGKGGGGEGEGGGGGGPSLCTPPTTTTSVCTGGSSGVKASGCTSDLPYDAKLPIGATYFLEQSFWEKGPSPAKIISVTVEGGHRQAELASNTPFVVTADDCAHAGNKDTGRDRIFVTWQNANGSTETDHLDMRYCKDGGVWNPGPPKKSPDSCSAAGGASSGGASTIPACAPVVH